ncbi:MAG: hypothetical protein CMJ48_13805 [Planctomycetaceae bacterium]|nr:hypothetical protein [Planctomycetaceae bacterium]
MELERRMAIESKQSPSGTETADSGLLLCNALVIGHFIIRCPSRVGLAPFELGFGIRNDEVRASI